MFSLFKSEPFHDAQLGDLFRSRGAWRVTLAVEGTAVVPLVVAGSRAAPDPDALRMAREISEEFPLWRPAIERALFEHYSPCAEAVAAGEMNPFELALPAVDGPSAVSAHAAIEFVQVIPLDGQLTVEIGYRVAWDEEHTLGARLCGGELIELCGSVLSP